MSVSVAHRLLSLVVSRAFWSLLVCGGWCPRGAAGTFRRRHSSGHNLDLGLDPGTTRGGSLQFEPIGSGFWTQSPKLRSTEARPMNDLCGSFFTRA